LTVNTQSSIELPASRIAALHAAVRDLHPVLDRCYPIGLAKDDRLMVFDADTDQNRYRLVCESVVPSPIRDGTRMTVTLPDYGNRPVCIVASASFESVADYVTIFHEFVHCSQWEDCEQGLASELAAAHPDVEHFGIWETRHPFRFEDERFVHSYSRLLEVLAVGDLSAVLECHREVAGGLAPLDRAFLVWHEWKEGFARWVENKVRRRLGLRRNQNGRTAPFGLGTLHTGGAGLIELLVRNEPGLSVRLKDLYLRLGGPCGIAAPAAPAASTQPARPPTAATGILQPVAC
jgi:hypothetical protein